jgi:MoxR-like ATPase
MTVQLPPIPDYPVSETPDDLPIDIPEHGTWPAGVHRFKAETVAALRAAEAIGRPLLVRGLPGVGKSQTARAAAAFANRPFLSVVIDGHTEPHDLMWRVDAVKRLSDAQAHQAKDELHYVQPQALWWAYDWDGARRQETSCGRASASCEEPRVWTPNADRAVLLIDEIDKADPDLPNALLDVLANKGFTPPFQGSQPVRCTAATRPLIVITTNEERELPPAFLRRCLSITLELPKDEQALIKELVLLGTQHQRYLITIGQWPGPCHVLNEAAERIVAVRRGADPGDYLPGTSEYLDLIGALATLYANNPAEQGRRIELLSTFIRKTRSLSP